MAEFEEKTRVDEIDRSLYDFKDKVDAARIFDAGLTEDTVLMLSEEKKDPSWMKELRLRSLKL